MDTFLKVYKLILGFNTSVVGFPICYFVSDAAVRILHVVERDHWVATSYHDGEVKLYDSVPSGSGLSSSGKKWNVSSDGGSHSAANRGHSLWGA